VSIATPRFYEIDTNAKAVAQTGQFWARSESNDWNASVAVNEQREATFTWTSNSTNPCVHTQVRFTGYQPGDNTAVLSPGTAVATSQTYYDPQNLFLLIRCGPTASDTCIRWGDYSAVSLDPSAYGTCAGGRRAWIVNETVLGNNRRRWSSHAARVGFC
jgi:hypothetical protein